MRGAYEVLLFGDETGDFREPLQKLCERQKGAVFLHFIESVNEVLRDEVRRQPSHVKKQIPPFSDVLDLVKQYQDSASRNPILETTLTCICQLASVVSYFNDHPSQYVVPSDTILVGLCTGLVAAAAVSASRSLLDLVTNAPSIVRVAFRVGVKVNGTAQRLSTKYGAEVNQSWSRLVVGVQKEASIAEVKQFNEKKGLPRASSAYVSSNSNDVVTISGPPATLTNLFLESELFRNRKTVPLDIFGPFHAPHLYSDADIEEIVQPVEETTIESTSASIRLISGATETSSPDKSMVQFSKDVVGDILVRPLSFDRIISAVVSATQSSGSKVCKISPVGPSNALSSLLSALRAGTETEISIGEQLGTTKSVNDSSGTATKIAVVGMAGRFPNANNLESLWNLLEQGLDVHRRIPPDRFDVEAHYDPTGKRKNTSHTPYGCFIEEPGLFDPRFFNMSPREAYQTDPMGRLALVTAYEALEMSGFVPNRTASSKLDRVGTFYGQTSDDWRQVNAAQKIDTYYIPGTIRAFASGRINYHFKFSGPSYNVDTACSSSFAAIQLACTSLQAKECDTAVAGGLNVMTAPDLFAGLSRAQFLSKTGSCKTFDDTADGFCRGDGVGTVILKRLVDAEADNDPILGVIMGTATNHSSQAVSITQPHAPTQETLYKKILRNTSVDAREVSYVEMHGTGTQAGDGAEMKSISNVFAPRHQGRLPGQTLHLGAIKANIGHGEASAGVASLIKVLLMLQRNAIPPHVGVKGTMNHTFPTDLEERGVRIAFKEASWLPPTDGKRRAYLNNFSAAGGNTGLLLEDAPKPLRMSNNDPRAAFVVSVTANSGWSLEKNIQKLVSYLEMNPDTSLPRLSYTTTARRIQQAYRLTFVASSISEVKEALMSAQAETVKPVPTEPPKVAFVFTGQGAHYPSLGKQFFENSKQFRSDIMEFDRIGRNQGFSSFLPLIDGTITDVNSLSSVVLQLGQSCIQMALARLWMSWGFSPSLVLGHSLGEYAALNVAGVLSVSDTIFLVGRRAELFQKSCMAGTHAMLAVAASVTSTRQVLVGETPEVACINGPRETVISGPTEQMISYSKTLKAAGIKCVLLPTAYAFHSAQVEAILDPFMELASSVAFEKPTIPVMSPLLREVVTGRDVFSPDYLARHARETVDFQGAITTAKGGVIDQNMVWVEIGPAPVCSAFIKSNLGSETVTVSSLRKNEDAWRTTSSGLSTLSRKGLHVDWNEVHSEYESSHTVLPLPSYAFENKNYWLEYTNNWCLNKGELLTPPTRKTRDRYLSTSSVQRLTTEDYGDKITLVAESDLSDPDLNNAVSGHLVNGSALCPSAIYADMAMTLASHLHSKVNKTSNAEHLGLNVSQLEIIKPLIAKARDKKEQQIVRITATTERPLKHVKISYNSITRDGSVGDLHATCLVDYGDTKSWLADWSRMAYLFRSRIDVLAQGADTGKYKRVGREPAYEAFSALVHYDKRYHGMKEIILDSKNFEATSLIEFKATESDGDFDISPYWIDNIAHLSGFVLNGSDAVDSRKQVYVSHGWESLQIARPLSAGRKYRNHVRMLPGPRQTMVGDVYVFDGEDMVALVGGVKFQAIPRSVLNKLLPPISGVAAHSKAQTTSHTNGISGRPKDSRHPKIETQPTPSLIETTHKPDPPTLHSTNDNGSVIKEFIGIISEELGLEPSGLSDAAAFANIGLDSLMSLTITGRIREELDTDIPTTLFIDKPTVGEAKAAILALVNPNSTSALSNSSPASAESINDNGKIGNNLTEIAVSNYSTEDATEKLLSIISEELGIEQSELLEMGNFADMGVDSLMSLTISGRAREELDLDIPSSFFTDYPSINLAKPAILALTGTHSSGDATPDSYTENITPDEASETSNSSSNSTPDEDMESLPSSFEDPGANDESLPPATSILLRGNPKFASKVLFLFPDGSGSATSYASLPGIEPDVCVYGLNCPFIKSPADYTNGIEGVSEQYLAEIKRRQAHGPYNLGGWSAGGIIAYQIAYRLLEMGEKTERLILIDSPCPINLEPLPSSVLHFIDSAGLLGNQNSTPEWLIPHFEASIINLAAYEPCPMDSRKAPKTSIIWARDGLCKDVEVQKLPRSARESKSVKFWLDNRLDFGPNGWEKLLGGENITTNIVEGNHFTLIRDPGVKQLPTLLRRGLGMQ